MISSSSRFHDGADGAPQIDGSGILGERVVMLPDAPRVSVAGPVGVELRVDPRQGAQVAFKILADDNILPHVELVHRDGATHIGLAPGSYGRLRALRVSATIGPLAELDATDAARVSLQGLCGAVALRGEGASRISARGSARSWQIDARGTSRVYACAADAQTLQVRSVHASEVQLEGRVAELALHAAGSGSLIAILPAFEAWRAELELLGSSRARVAVRERATGRVRFPSSLRLTCEGTIAIDGAYRCE
jgi:hypothetical protein